MKYFAQKIGKNEGEAVFYLQEPSDEIQPERKAPVLVIVPGGAYMWTSDREGEPVAAEYFSRGFSCVVVKYATEGRKFFKENTNPEKIPCSVFPNPLLELAQVMILLRKHAEEWKIDADRIAVAGFSAGGNLAGQLSVYWNTDWLTEQLGENSQMIKPNATILAYPMLNCIHASERKMINQWVNRAMLGEDVSEERLKEVSPVYQVNEDVPHTFLWHTMEDTFVPVENSLEYAQQLRKYKVPFELHIYQNGEHGCALGDERTDSLPDHSQINMQAATWVNLSAGWLKQIFS